MNHTAYRGVKTLHVGPKQASGTQAKDARETEKAGSLAGREPVPQKLAEEFGRTGFLCNS